MKVADDGKGHGSGREAPAAHHHPLIQVIAQQRAADQKRHPEHFAGVPANANLQSTGVNFNTYHGDFVLSYIVSSRDFGRN